MVIWWKHVTMRAYVDFIAEALGVEQAGHQPMIFSERVRSRMFGAMYLHRPIPGIHHEDDPPDFTLDITKYGTREGYARNVYGDPTADCSWDVIEEGETPAWDL